MNTLDFKAGIQIFGDSPRTSRILEIKMSAGTAPVSQSFREAYNYRSGALLPVEPWRKPTELEKQLLFADLSKTPATWQQGASIAVVKIPTELLETFDVLGLKTMHDYKDKTQVFENPRYNQIILTFVKQWLPYIPDLEGFKAYGLNIAPGGMPSITNDFSLHNGSRQFIGLHINEHEVVPVSAKIGVRNRLSVNMGRNDRFLMFFNLTLADLYRACKGYDPTPDLFYSVSQLTEEFAALYPTYPVIRLRIRPGEAYIAPAQNFIHDAYNPKASYPDITLNFIGRFDYKPDYYNTTHL